MQTKIQPSEPTSCVKTIFQIQKPLYKLTKLGLNNEQQRIESIFSTTSLTEVEKLSHLIGFLYVDGQEVHLSKWENSPREHT